MNSRSVSVRPRDFFERRVALASMTAHGAPLDLFDWVRHYLLREGDLWVASVALEAPSMDELTAWEPGGVVAHVSRPEMVPRLRDLGCPVVNLSGMLLPDMPFPTATLDNEATGETAADYLLERGFHRFAFAGFPEEHGVSRLRREGFLSRLAREGIRDVPVFEDWFHSLGLRPLNRIRRDSRETVAWLRSLPPDTAVFVPDDQVAGLLIRFLQAHGLNPFDTCALFSGHHMSATTRIGISGVLQPTRRWAHSAVRLLVDAMEGGGDDGNHVRVPNSGVIERESTVGFGTEDSVVAAAQRFILRHLHRDLNVGDVADANPLGRRSLEKKFSRSLGHSILDEIQLRKLSVAEHLLLHSGLSLEEVAQSAGFSDLRHFQRVMKKYRGETPGTYRRARLRQREREVDDA